MPSSCEPFRIEREFVRSGSTTEVVDPVRERRRIEAEAERERLREDILQTARSQWRLERETLAVETGRALAARLDALEQRIAAHDETLARTAAELALDAADFLSLGARAEGSAEPITAAIAAVLTELRRGTPFRVGVHPDLVEPVERWVAERQAADRRRLTIIVSADPGLAAGDAEIRWEAGSLRFDREARQRALKAEFDGLFPPPA